MTHIQIAEFLATMIGGSVVIIIAEKIVAKIKMNKKHHAH
jgi:hypothetical protein